MASFIENLRDGITRWADHDAMGGYTYHQSNDKRFARGEYSRPDSEVHADFYRNADRSIGDFDDSKDYAVKRFRISGPGGDRTIDVYYDYSKDANQRVRQTIMGVDDITNGKSYRGKDDVTSFYRNNFNMDEGEYDITDYGYIKGHSPWSKDVDNSGYGMGRYGESPEYTRKYVINGSSEYSKGLNPWSMTPTGYQ